MGSEFRFFPNKTKINYPNFVSRCEVQNAHFGSITNIHRLKFNGALVATLEVEQRRIAAKHKRTNRVNVIGT